MARSCVLLALPGTVSGPRRCPPPSARSRSPSTPTATRRWSLLERVVNINSGTHEHGRRARGGRRLPRGARRAGLPHPVGGRRGVRARRPPGGGAARGRAPRCACCSSATSTPCSRRTARSSASSASTATRARGPGTTDMKGGNVVMLLALRALRDAGTLDRMDVRVYLGGDEEDSGAPLAASRARPHGRRGGRRDRHRLRGRRRFLRPRGDRPARGRGVAAHA